MLMRGLTVVFISLLASETISHARIGETEERCIRRYGMPVERLEKGLLFIKNERKIYITFNNGIADSVFVQKLFPGSQRRAVPFLELEIKELLADNGRGCDWKYSAQLPDGDEVWLTKGSELGALYSHATLSFHVYTRENIVR